MPQSPDNQKDYGQQPVSLTLQLSSIRDTTGDNNGSEMIEYCCSRSQLLTDDLDVFSVGMSNSGQHDD